MIAQRDSIKADFHSDARADSLNARVTRLGTEIDRAFNAVNGARGPIEAWSGMPSVDQRRSLDYGIEDARKALADLNRLVNTEIPSAYQQVAKKPWSRKVNPVSAPSAAPHAH